MPEYYGTSPGYRLQYIAETPRVPVDALDTLFVLDDITFSPLGNGHALLSNARLRKQVRVQDAVANLARHCDHMRTLEGHVEHIRATLRPPEELLRQLPGLLGALRAHGMTLSARDLAKRLARPATPESNARDWVFAVHSRDRPVLLERMLASAKPYLAAMEYPPSFIFVDDSRLDDACRANRRVVAEFSDRLGLDARYLDRAARAERVESLARLDPSMAPALHWLFNPLSLATEATTAGQAKNWVTMLAGARPLIMADDDIVIAPRRLAGTVTAPSLAARPPRLTAFHGTDDLDARTEALAINPFQEHLARLGQPLASVIGATEGGLGPWHDARRDELLQLGPDDYVGRTVNSVLGAQNSRHMDIFFSQSVNPRDQEDFLAALGADDEIEQLSAMAPSGDVIGKARPFICTTLSGIAAGPLAVPTLPRERNEDLFLGDLQGLMYPRNHLYRFAWMLRHQPDPTRSWTPRGALTMASFNVSAALRYLLDDCRPSTRTHSPEDTLAYFAQRVASWLGEAEAKREKFMADYYAEYLSSQIDSLERLAGELGDRPLFLAGVRSLLQARQAQLNGLFDHAAVLARDFVDFLGPLPVAYRLWPTLVSRLTEAGEG